MGELVVNYPHAAFARSFRPWNKRRSRRGRHRRTLPGAGAELDRGKREARLHRIQLLIFDKVAVTPIWQNVPLNSVGAKVEESGIRLVAG